MNFTENSSLWKLKIFILSLLLPVDTYVEIGSMRLTGYRIILLILFVPCFFNIIFNKKYKVLQADICIFAYSVWLFISLMVGHNFNLALESGGILIVESFGGYLIARSVVRDIRDYEIFVNFMVKVFFVISLLAVCESLTGFNFFRPSVGHSDPRFGFDRAIGPFQHAILLGVFCSSVISLSWFNYHILKGPNWGSISKTIFIVLGSASSVSSGALFAIVIQFILISWNYILGVVRLKWHLLFFIFFIFYISIDILSSRPPLRVILHRLTFSSHTAYTRLNIWEYGFYSNVVDNPFFGIGFNEWSRPEWLGSSIDSFWLVTMIRHGIPAFIFIVIGIILLVCNISKNCHGDNSLKQLSLGWTFSVLSLVFAASTVHFWNQLYVWFFFLLGAGGWMAVERKDLNP